MVNFNRLILIICFACCLVHPSFVIYSAEQQPELTTFEPSPGSTNNDTSETIGQKRKKRQKSKFNKAASLVALGCGALSTVALCGLLASLKSQNPEKCSCLPKITGPWSWKDDVKFPGLEFYNLAALLEKVKDIKNPKPTPRFNVIFQYSWEKLNRGWQENNPGDDILNIWSTACLCCDMKNLYNNGALFQFAANDNPRIQTGGGQAASVLPATETATKARLACPINSLGTLNNNPANINNILIGLHKNINVKDCPESHKINLLLTAARNLGQFPNTTEDIKKNCFKVIYDGALLAAASLINESGAPTVFLTMVGCGIFGNKPKDAIDAIESSVEEYLDKFGLNVILLYQQIVSNYEEYPNCKEDDNRVLGLARKHNGYILRLKGGYRILGEMLRETKSEWPTMDDFTIEQGGVEKSLNVYFDGKTSFENILKFLFGRP